MEIAIAKIANSVASAVAPLAIKTVQSKLNPSDLEKAIQAGILAARDREATLAPQQTLFYRSEPDFVDRFLKQFLSREGVLKELGKASSGGESPDVAYLVKEFARSAQQNDKITLQDTAVAAWIEEFVKHYFQQTSTYLKFQVAKEDYLKQLCEQYDDVKFAGMSVAGQESEKCARLADIFVMPDVIEERQAPAFERYLETLPDRQMQLWEEQRQRAMLDHRSGAKYSARELFKRGSKAVLLGAPGSGKTTLTGYFVTVFARNWREEITKLGFDPQGDILPVPIRIRDLARFPDLSILDYLKQNAETSLCVKTLPVGFFQHWLEDGRALILLDGLDEVADEAQRYKMVERIECFLKQFKNNPALITSRPAGYRRDFFRTEDFPHAELQPFDREKIDNFIDLWYDSRFSDPREAKRRKTTLRKALDESDRVQVLASNPLLLTIIALIHRYQAILPRDRHKLYEKAVETLITAWDANKELSSHKVLQYLNLDDLGRLMERLAYWIHSQGGTGDAEGGTLINRDELLRQLTAEIKQMAGVERYKAAEEAKRFIALMRDRTGLLNEQGQDCYAFVHKTFQEYLCAQEIQYRHEDEDFEVVLEHIQEHLHDPHWREVLLLLVAQQKPKKAIKAIRAILERGSEYECWLHHDLLFAGRCLGEFTKGLLAADRALVEEILQRLVSLEVDKRVGEKVREQVFEVLCKLGETECEGQVLQLLKEKKGEIDNKRVSSKRRWTAANVFENLGSSANKLDFPALQLFMERLSRAANRRFQKYQVALGEEDVVIQAWLARLQDEDLMVRLKAVEALGKLGSSDTPVINTLLLCLQDESSKMRWSAAVSLRELGCSTAVLNTLFKYLNDTSSSVRWKAAETLGKLGKDDSEVINTLLSYIQDKNSSVRSSAAFVLGNLGNSSSAVIKALLEYLQNEDSSVRSSAAVALGKSGSCDLAISDALLPYLQDKCSDVRSSAAFALGNLGNSDPRIINALSDCLKDERFNVQWDATRSLEKLASSNPVVIDALLPHLQDENPSVRWSIADVLGNSGDSSPAVIEALLPHLQDENPSVRWSVADAFKNLGSSDSAVIKALFGCLQDESPDVRWSAALALGNLGNGDLAIINTLLQYIQDENSFVPSDAADTLGKLGKKLDCLLPALVQWLRQHQDAEFIGIGIDALWQLVEENAARN